MNRLFDSQVNDRGLTEDSWKILEPAIRDIVCRMIRREKTSSLFERTSGTSHLDENQLIENVCDRIRNFLVSEIADFETNDNQPTKILLETLSIDNGN